MRVTLAANRRSEKRFFNNVNDFLRSVGWNRFSGTTDRPLLPISVDQVLSRTYESPGHTDQC